MPNSQKLLLDYREGREQWEWENLAPYASHSSDHSLSWRRSEADPHVRRGDTVFPARPALVFPGSTMKVSRSGDLAGTLSRFKTAFQIDIERISSSNAFRRLEYKTQVFVTHVGDHFRTRLTHVIEVSETARIIGQVLRLNEDLVEAIALGHDLGHTPFGHVGEEAIARMFMECWPKQEPFLQSKWGEFGPAFYHNVQSVRVVDKLENGYEWDRRPVAEAAAFDPPDSRRGWGMDLTWAVREGILKHSSRGLKAGQLRMYGSQYLMDELEPFSPATLEGQVVEFADELTSIMHDLEDGLRYRLFTLDELQETLLPHLTEKNLTDLLGLSPRFGMSLDEESRSRLGKLTEMLHTIESRKDRTVGTLLALLRTILLSNLIETTSLRLTQAMSEALVSSGLPELTAEPARPEQFLLAEIQLGAPTSPQPTATSYCAEAWDPAARPRVFMRLQHYQRNADHTYTLTHEDRGEDWQLFWLPHAGRPEDRRQVLVLRGGRPLKAYPLGQICLRFRGCKLVGYSPAVWALRNSLREKFIPEYIHHAATVVRMNDKGSKYLQKVFAHFVASPHSMHSHSLRRFGLRHPNANDPKFILRIVEHLQGMTDRYLEQVYSHLFLPGGHHAEMDEVSLVDDDRPSSRA